MKRPGPLPSPSLGRADRGRGPGGYSAGVRVVFIDADLDTFGTVVEPPEWASPGLPHVVWDGDDYVCVLRPSEIRAC